MPFNTFTLFSFVLSESQSSSNFKTLLKSVVFLHHFAFYVQREVDACDFQNASFFFTPFS